MLTRRAPWIFARSSISWAVVAIIGDAPSAIVALADWAMTTLFVIWKEMKDENYATISFQTLHLMNQRTAFANTIHEINDPIYHTGDTVVWAHAQRFVNTTTAFEWRNQFRKSRRCLLWNQRSHYLWYHCHSIQSMIIWTDTSMQSTQEILGLDSAY